MVSTSIAWFAPHQYGADSVEIWRYRRGNMIQ
jgi:hypothetical protein